MSQADIDFLEVKLNKYKIDFQKLVPLKKTPDVYRRRQSLKNQIATLNRWIIELKVNA